MGSKSTLEAAGQIKRMKSTSKKKSQTYRVEKKVTEENNKGLQNTERNQMHPSSQCISDVSWKREEYTQLAVAFASETMNAKEQMVYGKR